MQDLNSLSDLDLINNVKSGSSSNDSLTELVSRHSGIYISMVNNYSPATPASPISSKEELIKDKDYYIYQAALKYDESKKTKFSTYLGNETRWLCLNLYNKNKNNKEFAGIDWEYLHPPSEEPSLPINQDALDKVLSIVRREPDKRVTTIFKKRYIDGDKNKVMPWHKVCKSVNLSIQGCINIHNKTIKKIQEELKKEL